MAGMKSWLEKIKDRILKKDLDDDLLKSKIQRNDGITKDTEKENELPDLITPTNEKIEHTSRAKQKENETQKPRKEAMKVKEMHEITDVKENKKMKMLDIKSQNEGFVHFTDVPKRTKTA